MPERRYFDESGEPSDEPGRFVNANDLAQLTPGPASSSAP
jgi:hypothetical protein